MEGANGFDDVFFGDVECESSSELEKGLKHGNGSYTFAGFFAKGFDKSACPDGHRFWGDLACEPSLRPELDGCCAIRGLEEGKQVSVASSRMSRMRGLLQGA